MPPISIRVGATKVPPGRGQVVQHAALGAGLFDVIEDGPARGGVDHRADVGGQVPGVAQAQLVHRARSMVRTLSFTSFCT